MVEPAAKQITTVIHSRHRPNSVYHAMTLTDILEDGGHRSRTMLTMVLLIAGARSRWSSPASAS